MKKIIDYSNNELEKKIKSEFGESYGTFQPIIVDLLLKRNYVLGLTEEQSIAEARRFMDNVGSIQYGKLYLMSGAIAFYSPKQRKIAFQPNRDTQYVYGILVHEIFHVLGSRIIDEDGNEKNLSFNNIEKKVCEDRYSVGFEISNWRFRELKREEFEKFEDIGDNGKTLGVTGSLTMETINEDTARLFYNRSGVGYKSTSFFPYVLASAIGASNIELLKAGNSSLQNFLDMTYSHFPQNKKAEVDSYLTMLDAKLKGVHNGDVYISMALDMLAFKEIKELRNNFNKDFEGLFNTAYSMFEFQIENDERGISDEFVAEMAVRYKRIEKELLNAQKIHKYNISKNCKKNIKLAQLEVLQTIGGLYIFNKIKHQIKDKSLLKEYENTVKSGKIEQFSQMLLQDFPNENLEKGYSEFAEYMEEKDFEKSEYYKNLVEKDMFNGKVWNMEEVWEMMENCLEMDKGNSKKKNFKLPGIKDVLNDKSITESRYEELEDKNEYFLFYKNYCKGLIGNINCLDAFVKNDMQDEIIYNFKKYYSELMQYTNFKQYKTDKGIDIDKVFDTFKGVQFSKTEIKNIVKEFSRRGFLTEEHVKNMFDYFDEKNNSVEEKMYELYALDKYYKTNGLMIGQSDIQQNEIMHYFDKDEFDSEMKKHYSLTGKIARKLNNRRKTKSSEVKLLTDGKENSEKKHFKDDIRNFKTENQGLEDYKENEELNSNIDNRRER